MSVARVGKPTMEKAKKKKLIERIVILVLALAIVGLLIYFVADVFVPFIKIEVSNDPDKVEKAREFLTSRGWKGYLTISLVEALQMVVIFIPAEFIQTTTGMTYPWWQAILLLDAGVILGATIIYLIVNVFKFNGDVLNKQKKIARYEKMNKSKSTIILMTFLFFMPVIPFGAICYYGSSRKIKYWKYALTCMLAVLPSIGTSILLGSAVKEVILDAIPVWALVLVIIGGMAILFVLVFILLHLFFFRHNDGTPDSIFYGWLMSAIGFILRWKYKYKIINKEALDGLEGSFLMIVNHHCWSDFNAIFHLDPDRGYAFVMNQFYMRIPILGKLFKRAGYIPKKMFAMDLPCAKKIFSAHKAGYPVCIFPEARLSTDGGPAYIPAADGALAKYFRSPLVLVQIRNAYFAKPKWRKKTFRTKVEVEVMRVVSPEELKEMTLEEVNKVIAENIQFNEFQNESLVYKQKNKAKGLESALYMCPHCGALYSNVTKGNKMTCSNCGKEYEIKENYHFTDPDIKNLSEYYSEIKRIEREHLDEINMDIEVDVKIFTDNKRKIRKDKGVFHFDSEKVVYTSSLQDFSFTYTVAELEGIAYGINEEFEMYYNNELYYFYPSNMDRKVCTRVALLYELLKEREADGANKD